MLSPVVVCRCTFIFSCRNLREAIAIYSARSLSQHTVWWASEQSPEVASPSIFMTPLDELHLSNVAC